MPDSGNWVDRVTIGLVFLIAPLYAITTWSNPFRPTAVLGMAIPVISIELVLVLFLGLSVGSIWRKLIQVDRATIVLFIAIGISTGVSMASAEAVTASARFYYILNGVHALVAYLLYCRFWYNASIRPIIVWAICASITTYVLIVVLLSLSVSTGADFDWEVFGAGVTNVRQMAFYALILTGSGGALVLSAATAPTRSAATICLFAGIFLCLWCGGRAAFGALCIQQGVLLFFATKRKRWYLGTLLACAILAAPLSVWLAPSPLYGVQSVFGRVITQGPQMSYDSGRGAIWLQTAKAILEEPFFGHGEGQFRWEVPAVQQSYNHPHNVFLQLLYQWGFIGTSLVFLLLWRLAGGASEIRSAVVDDSAFASIGVMTGLGAVSLLDGPFFYPYPALVTLIAVALYCSSNAPALKTSGAAYGVK